MKNVIILILILLIIFLLVNNENFIPVSIPKAFTAIDLNTKVFFGSPNVTTTSIYQNRFNLIPSTFGDGISEQDQLLYKKELTSNKCCLVEKKTFDNTSTINNIDSEYKYTEYTDTDCDLNNFDLNENKQLFFDGINNWSNNYCSNKTTNLGSCQHYDMECIDFVSEQQCKEYNDKMPVDRQNRNKIIYKWNPNTCYAIKT
jgi:hypothetical protein